MDLGNMLNIEQLYYRKMSNLNQIFTNSSTYYLEYQPKLSTFATKIEDLLPKNNWTDFCRIAEIIKRIVADEEL